LISNKFTHGKCSNTGPMSPLKRVTCRLSDPRTNVPSSSSSELGGSRPSHRTASHRIASHLREQTSCTDTSPPLFSRQSLPPPSSRRAKGAPATQRKLARRAHGQGCLASAVVGLYNTIRLDVNGDIFQSILCMRQQ
jgi:hypothetical protein